MKSLFRSLMCSLCLLMANHSSADVLFSFSGFYPAPGYTALVPASFELRVADFPAHALFVPAAAGTCTVSGQTCVGITLYPDATVHGMSSDHEAMFGLVTGTPMAGVEVAYYFTPGAFSAPGVHEALFDRYPGVLTISAVPEPAGAGMLVAGLAAIAAWRARPGRAGTGQPC